MNRCLLENFQDRAVDKEPLDNKWLFFLIWVLGEVPTGSLCSAAASHTERHRRRTNHRSTLVTWCGVLIVCVHRSKIDTNHTDEEQTAVNVLCFCANPNRIKRTLSHFVSESDALFNSFVLKTKQLLFPQEFCVVL